MACPPQPSFYFCHYLYPEGKVGEKKKEKKNRVKRK